MSWSRIMSWCRWSTVVGNKQCGLYIYESVGDQIVVHVAGRQRANYGDNPHKLPNMEEYKQKYGEGWIEPWAEDYSKTYEKHSKWMNENTIWEDLPEKWAGKDFYFNYELEEYQSLKEMLNEMKSDGLIFPEYIFDYVGELEKQDESSN